MLATWYNNASLAVLAAGFLTPFWTIIYGTAAGHPDDLTRTIGFIICVTIGAILRYLSSQALSELEE